MPHPLNSYLTKQELLQVNLMRGGIWFAVTQATIATAVFAGYLAHCKYQDRHRPRKGAAPV